MSFPDKLAAFLRAEGITQYTAIPFSALRVWDPDLLRRKLDGREAQLQSALLLVFPYYTGDYPGRNLSLYALPRDYHLFAKDFFTRLIVFLREHFPTALFCGFADHSPIDERAALAAAGLGVIGDNGLFITKEYGSYVFLGELLSSLRAEEWSLPPRPVQPCGCLHCGKCREICPRERLGGCLSFLTQQKGELSLDTIGAMRKYRTVWGCDLCQTVCPLNRGVKPSPIPFFGEQIVPFLTYAAVEAMSKEEFAHRAYSWRGKKTILRNLLAFEETEEDKRQKAD